ncbi:MAG: type IV secretion system DNA-binding domain-containing protein [Thermomicrobiales bacterium]
MTSRIRLGRYASTRVPFAKPVEALRTAVYVAGSPGMGKSTLLGTLCEQFCAAGDGVVLLDIKGDLARDIAARSRQPEQIVYVQPGVITTPAGERVWTLNPFEGHRGQPYAPSQIATNVLDSFDRMGRTELAIMANIRQTLAHAIRLALTTREPTLLDLLLIVVDQPYRQQLLREAKHLNHVTRRFWQDLDDPKLPARERRNQLNTTRNRLEALLMDRELNLFVGAYHSTLRLREWLDAGRMILIDLGLPLPRGLGVDIGNVIMAQLVTETFLRSASAKARTWRLVVDEFHEFVGDNFTTIITDARSYNVFPVLAHQDRSQLERMPSRSLKAAVGHAGVRAHLASSPEDRVAFASLYGRDQADLLLGLDRYKAVVSIMDGLAGTRQTETLVLDDWWGPPLDGQLDELKLQAAALTPPKREVVQVNNQRYWDRLDAVGAVGKAGETRERRAKPPKPQDKQAPARPGPSQSRPGPAPAARDDPPRPAGADAPRPASLLDGPPDL